MARNQVSMIDEINPDEFRQRHAKADERVNKLLTNEGALASVDSSVMHDHERMVMERTTSVPVRVRESLKLRYMNYVLICRKAGVKPKSQQVIMEQGLDMYLTSMEL